MVDFDDDHNCGVWRLFPSDPTWQDNHIYSGYLGHFHRLHHGGRGGKHPENVEEVEGDRHCHPKTVYQVGCEGKSWETDRILDSAAQRSSKKQQSLNKVLFGKVEGH